MLRTVRDAVATALRAASLHDRVLVPTISRMIITPIPSPSNVRFRPSVCEEPKVQTRRLGPMSNPLRRSVQLARPQVFHIALLSALLVTASACATFRGPGASPAPTDAAPPTSTLTPVPTPEATTASTIRHPTGASDVVLRMESGGGLVPMEFFVTQAPQFTLYGDGTVVFMPLPDPNGFASARPYPPFLTGTMAEKDVQDLLSFALNDGGLADAKDSYDYPMIADASTTLVDVDAGGVHKHVSVYALLEATNDGPDQADRNALGKLMQRLAKFE